MTAVEAYELTTQGGATDFARLIAACEAFGPYCLIGGLAVNCFVEPVYALDADIVISHPLNATTPVSQLRIQFTTDDRYQAFLARSVAAEVLGVPVKIACLDDVTQGKLWAYGHPRRRLSKRKKDELDLIRLAEAYPKLKSRSTPRSCGNRSTGDDTCTVVEEPLPYGRGSVSRAGFTEPRP
jgi:hypothetical protein